VSVPPTAPSPWEVLDRTDWAGLRAATPLTLTADELEGVRGIGESIDLTEVEQVYLPLTRLLNLHVAAVQELQRARTTFLATSETTTPFLVGIAGSVAVGKSTTARLLQVLLQRWPDHPRVDLLTTDGFLLPNADLVRRGILDRKGFPESYDVARLLRTVAAVKAGTAVVRAPVYSHLTYDVVPDAHVEIRRPDILIVEGLNVLQSGTTRAEDGVFVSDYFDFSLYVDAAVEHIRSWYVERFLALRETAFRDERSYFRRYAALDEDEARAVANRIWTSINEVNLHENVLPTRSRADLVLRKGADHRVEEVRLRRL
jgi:type I pantothenate kinase